MSGHTTLHQRRSRLWAALAGLSCGAAWILAQAQNAENDKLVAQERASLQAVCGKCHNLEVVTNAAMSYEAWHDTVQTMIDRGAQGTDDQLEDVMDYLHRTETTINVNLAEGEELGIVLEVPDPVVKLIIERRKQRKFDSLADLKTIPGLQGSVLDAKARLLFFR